MKVQERPDWVLYINDELNYDYDKCGKWMYFSKDINFMSEICSKAVSDKVVTLAKHRTEEWVAVRAKYSNKDEGVACFYLNYDDIEAHKKILSFFIDNNLVSKTKEGRFYNISFKFDSQTRARQYGEDFCSEIKLSNFIDLNSGEWLT